MRLNLSSLIGKGEGGGGGGKKLVHFLSSQFPLHPTSEIVLIQLIYEWNHNQIIGKIFIYKYLQVTCIQLANISMIICIIFVTNILLP